MFQYTQARCKQCLLQEDKARNFLIDENGLCNICANWQEEEKDWGALEKRFEDELEALRARKKEFDVVLMMSGGKDSAYLAWLLKRKYNLKILAVTIDNNFEYEETFLRAAEIAKELDLPQIQYRLAPELTKLFYRFIMSEQPLKEKDFGQLCLYCGKYLLDQGVRVAESFDIPGVIAGYNPDQLFGMGKCIEVEDSIVRIRQQEAILKKINYHFNKAANHAAGCNADELLPLFSITQPKCKIVYPFLYLPYKPLEMMEVVMEEINWKPIESFSKGNYIASGCKLLKLMAALAKINNISSYMDLEFSNQIRTGALNKEALSNYYESLEESEEFYLELLEQLGLTGSVQDLARLDPH